MIDVQRLTQAERTEISDARMLEAAVELIVERGVDNTTLKDVGELAGYSRGLAGYRFGNKAGLFEFVVRSIGEEWLRELTQATRKKVGYEAIAAAVDAHYRMCRAAPHHVAAFYILWFGAIGPQSEVRSVIAGIHDRRRKDVEAWIEQGIEAGVISSDTDVVTVANQFSASVIGILYQWLVNPDDMRAIKKMYDGLKQTMKLWLSPPADA
jgi:AcrR family transcriptional regulator